MNISYVRPDGITLHPGEWLDIGKGIGKFAGIWDNPKVGLMTTLDCYRTREEPDDRDTLWMSLPGNEGILDSARVVAGPLTSSGREPKPKDLPRMDRPGWTRDRVTTVATDGYRCTVTGWILGAFGISPYIARTAIGKMPLAALTHLRTGARFATFDKVELAAEMAEIAGRVAAWEDLGTIEELKASDWTEAAGRTFKAWAQVGIGQVIDIRLSGDRRLLVRRSDHDEAKTGSLQ